MSDFPAGKLTISALRAAYRDGSLTPEKLMTDIRERAARFEEHNIWIHLLTQAEQEEYLAALHDRDPEVSPLWGVPFAIKDNIDLAGIPTTAACEAFTHTPEVSATVVRKLIDAGAIPVGKTNLDQFATGLNGTRSPWGACRNSVDPEYISGGSSSGSAVAVALGLASFSLGTDTAGSGRVPAGFNNLVGVKPTRGIVSTLGVVPACRSLDCVSIFALNTDDANLALGVAEGFDKEDAYSRSNPYQNQARHYGRRDGPLCVGIIPPGQLQFFGDTHYAEAYRSYIEHLSAAGVEFREVNYDPFQEAARMLYEGPWVAERYLAAQPLITEDPETIFPVVREIIAPGALPRATSLFESEYRLRELKRQCLEQLSELDCLLVPTAGRCFTVSEMLKEPILRNSQLGYYTNFMNLLDLSAVAVPAGLAAHGIPFGVTLVGPRFSDRALLSIARRVFLGADPAGECPGSDSDDLPEYAPRDEIDVLVCGAHMDGLPLNWQLSERGARLKSTTTTAPAYRMYALAGGPPYRPGLIRDEARGAAVEAEVWSVPADQFGSFVSGIPAPLGIGKVKLSDGSEVCGFICEPCGVEGAREITHLGGWRAFLSEGM